MKTFEQFINESLKGGDLPVIQKWLKDNGFELANYDLDNPTNIAGNPLVRDGLDGIRASYHKRRDELNIWFTNLYQDSNNETRQKVENFLLGLKNNI